ncbi:MAG: hypothetical protein B7Z02_17385 [Rhodobacterales bacterium 32-67-9]|nr:MAG: hypothetical protein B7Z02_17385 [Rhodobacterales bacterium 32-67-9]
MSEVASENPIDLDDEQAAVPVLFRRGEDGVFKGGGVVTFLPRGMFRMGGKAELTHRLVVGQGGRADGDTHHTPFSKNTSG